MENQGAQSGMQTPKTLQLKISLKTAKTVTVEANSTDLIQDIKAKVREMEGLAENQQELFFHGNRLKDTSRTLADYNIGTNSTINLTFGGMMHILVKFLSTGETIMLAAHREDSVTSVKAEIENKEGVYLHRQVLIYKGRSLENNHTLMNCNIKGGSILQLILRPTDQLYVRMKNWLLRPNDHFHISVRRKNWEPLQMEVRSWYTVRYVKLIVEDMEGVDASKQMLIYDGRELDDQQTLSECQITDRSALHLQVEIQIFVKNCGGSTFMLMVDNYDTVGATIKKIEEKMGIKLLSATLSYAGRILEEEGVLATHHVQNGSTVHLHMAFCSSDFEKVKPFFI